VEPALVVGAARPASHWPSGEQAAAPRRNQEPPASLHHWEFRKESLERSQENLATQKHEKDPKAAVQPRCVRNPKRSQPRTSQLYSQLHRAADRLTVDRTHSQPRLGTRDSANRALVGLPSRCAASCATSCPRNCWHFANIPRRFVSFTRRKAVRIYKNTAI